MNKAMQNARKAGSARPARDRLAAIATTRMALTIVPASDNESVQERPTIRAVPSASATRIANARIKARTGRRPRRRVARQGRNDHEEKAAPADEGDRLVEERGRRRDVEGDERRQQYGDAGGGREPERRRHARSTERRWGSEGPASRAVRLSGRPDRPPCRRPRDLRLEKPSWPISRCARKSGDLRNYHSRRIGRR